MFKNIAFKLIVAVGVTALLIIGVFSFYNIRSHSEAMLSEVERHANQLSETVKYSTQHDMLLNQRERIHKIINTIGEQPGIKDVRILNKVGEIIYSSNNQDIGKMVDKNAESCYACHAKDKPIERLAISERTRIFKLKNEPSRVMGIINPIYNKPACWNAECHVHSQSQTVLGVLDVNISLSDVDRQIQTGERDIVIFAVSAIIALSLLIGFFVKRWVDAPIRELLKATKEVGTGNLKYRIQDKPNDEFGILARSFNDMTHKLSDARTQLFQSDKLASIGRLAAGVAHEINNPLTGVLTYSTMLLKTTRNNPEIHEDLKVIVRETIRSREIVKSLLDFARQSVPKKTLVHINDSIDLSVQVVENQLSINHIHLVKDLDPDLPKITVDSNQMQQVFINLLVNASDAIGPRGGKITISNRLIKLSPHGILSIKNATCPKGHNLMDNDTRIEGMPSIKIKIRAGSEEGCVNLDPVYGRHQNVYSMDITRWSDIEALCVKCGTSLSGPNERCPECAANTYEIVIPSQGVLKGCLSEKCKWQKWDTVDQAGQKEYIEIVVRDTGCGIAKENIGKIFEPFYSTKELKGTGLGLAVIWGILDNHNGVISVESECNVGTSFKVLLPVG